LRRLLGLACAALAACGSPAPEKSDWERDNETRLLAPEETPAPPAYPVQSQLVRFFTLERSDFHFFVDASSISIGRDGVVRYVLVARSPDGADNVTFEGMRCSTPELKIYAVGREGGWAGKPGAWRGFEAGRTQPWHRVLYRDFFCPGRAPISSPERAAAVLRRGGMRGMTD
jgi:CNP1-like family